MDGKGNVFCTSYVLHGSCISREVQFSVGDEAQKFSKVTWSTRRKEKAELFPFVWVGFVGFWVFFFPVSFVYIFLLSEDPGYIWGRVENGVDQKGSPPHGQPQAVHTEAWSAQEFLLSKLV